MLITSLKLTNFRCFGPESVNISLRDTTALIGNNGSGKSAILWALLRLFGTSQFERTLVRTDFRLQKDQEWEEVTESRLRIEATLEFPELASDKTSKAAATAFKHMTVDANGGRPYCRIRIDGTWRQSNLPEGEIEQNLVWVITAEGVDPEQIVGVLPHDRSRIHVHYIPAMRDPARQIRHASGSVLHSLLQAVKWSEEVKQQVLDSSGALQTAFASEAGVQEIQDAIKTNWQALNPSAEHADVAIRPVGKRLEDLLKQVEAVFSPGPAEKEEGIERLSDGQKSLFYLALVTSIFEIQNSIRNETTENISREKLDPPVLNIFAVEEPENHVAPHYIGRIMSVLRRIGSSEFGQIVLSSHSPGILARIEPEEVRYLRIDTANQNSIVREIKLPNATEEAFKFVRQAVRSYPELYFSKYVILGEGDSEQIILPRLSQGLDLAIDQSFVSVVPLGGRHVNHFWRLLEQLEIPYSTLLDLDRERDGGGWGRIKYALTELLNVGRSQSSVLPSNISRDQLEAMHTWDVTSADNMNTWLPHLEERGIFFSAPLDIDFMMLRAFASDYEGTVGDDAYGPRIPTEPSKYSSALESVVSAVLKEGGTEGATYSAEEKKAFFWYRYLFLGRSKPSTHIQALTQIDDFDLMMRAPQVLDRLIKRVKKTLGNDVVA